MSRKLHRHLKRHWILKDEREPISTMPLNTFNTLTGVQQREYVRSLIRLGFGADAKRYQPHLKSLNK